MIIHDFVTAARASADDTGEFRPAPEAGTVTVPSVTHGARCLRYGAIDGLAVFEGDIVLGDLDEVEAPRREEGVAITGAESRWPGGVVPFEIDPALPDPQRVAAAVAHWNARTTLRFVPRAAAHVDFIRFVPGAASRSPVGRRGGRQTVELTVTAPVGTVVHEMGHAIGLWHEQSRADRAAFVDVRLTDVAPETRHNFAQHITDGDDIGDYDFGSIMHYPATAFSVTGRATIVPRFVLPPGVVMGQRVALSAGDIAAADALYPDAAAG
ncbi:M12 family metallopeptidase [Nocardia thailandica]